MDAPKRIQHERQSDEPQEVSESVWYYEEGRKLGFVVRTQDFNKSSGETIQFSVPLRMLEKSLARSPRKRKGS